MIGLANPLGLVALASVGVLIALTLLAHRSRTSAVSSLLLWRQLPARRIERQRFRPDLLFALRLLLLLALVAALVRPYRAAPGGGGGDVAVVLDVSASMQVPEDDGTRLDLARRRVDALVAGLPANAAVLLIGAAERPRLALRWSTDRGRLAQRLRALTALDTPTALGPAVRLALGEASRRPGARVAVFTDLPTGATDLSDDEIRTVEWRTVGRRGDNVAITGLTVTAPPFAAPRDVAVDVELRNFDVRPRTVSLDARLEDAPWLRNVVELAPHAVRTLRLDRPPRAGVLRLTLEGGGDALAVDDRAVAWVPSEPPLDVLLVTESDMVGAALNGLVDAVPAARLEVVNAAGLRERARDESRAGTVTVYDRSAPAGDARGNALYLAPPPGNAVCPSAREVDDAAVVDWEDDHPVLAGLRGLQAVEAARAVQLLPPEHGDVVMTAASRHAAYPFLIADERDGRRRACLSAALPGRLATSDALPLALLILGTLRWLAGPVADAPITLPTGVPVRVGGTVAIGPAGSVRAVGEPSVVLATRAGIHRGHGAGGGERLVLASLLDAAESDVGRAGGGDRAPAAPPAVPGSDRRRDLSPWALGAALLLLVLEWVAWGLLP